MKRERERVTRKSAMLGREHQFEGKLQKKRVRKRCCFRTAHPRSSFLILLHKSAKCIVSFPQLNNRLIMSLISLSQLEHSRFPAAMQDSGLNKVGSQHLCRTTYFIKHAVLHSCWEPILLSRFPVPVQDSVISKIAVAIFFCFHWKLK